MNEIAETVRGRFSTEAPEAVLSLQELEPSAVPDGPEAADPAVLNLFYSLFCWTKWT